VHDARERTALRGLGRPAAGWLRVAAWAAVLIAADRPWRELGGILGERMRWLERFVLGAALVAGSVAGAFLRDAAGDPARAGPGRLLRGLWVAPSAAAACVLVCLELRGAWPWILLVVAAWVGYGAGLDVTWRAWPLVRRERPACDPPTALSALSVAPETGAPASSEGRSQRSPSRSPAGRFTEHT
jgi:hypothetical protein